MVVIGLGSGRSGTASLAKLLNTQKNALCFHEMNPSCVRHDGTPQPILTGVKDMHAITLGGDHTALTVDLSRAVAAKEYDLLQEMDAVSLLGDIAHYYLSYVEAIIALNLPVKFICLKRDRHKTIKSWLNKTTAQPWKSKRLANAISSLITREPNLLQRNPWMKHDGSRYAIDPVWDKCFPKFPGPSREDAAGQYYDYYYDTAEALANKHEDCFWMIETEKLDDPTFQTKLLNFCGIDAVDHVHTDAHIHKSAC